MFSSEKLFRRSFPARDAKVEFRFPSYIGSPCSGKDSFEVDSSSFPDSAMERADESVSREFFLMLRIAAHWSTKGERLFSGSRKTVLPSLDDSPCIGRNMKLPTPPPSPRFS